MAEKKKILAICGSASPNSANLSILKTIAELGRSHFDLELLDDLSEMPHFKTDLTDKNVPEKIMVLRKRISDSEGIIICTPEYVFSIPSGLKNVIEWCVSTTVFSDKPVGLITASASGKKGHEELKLIMETVQSKFTDETTLLIQGIKGKIDREGHILDTKTEGELKKFVRSFNQLMEVHTTE
ncbi:NAD(P)H-dependent FMN reductase [Zobellia uliginosa]|uniref:NAD(P)H-dependent FMN reductase n=1 Tax=Zobellia uliginosa TaxID=143224 RepID=A0ABY1L1C7_9FLAO|nr:NADPH-dependent FMN reductase [Zobellia uliginosa]SIT08940.1 NAD(P)H-dependent FMN reductase [Zobellia uliginosa]